MTSVRVMAFSFCQRCASELCCEALISSSRNTDRCALPSQPRVSAETLSSITDKPAGNDKAMAITSTVIRLAAGVSRMRRRASFAEAIWCRRQLRRRSAIEVLADWAPELLRFGGFGAFGLLVRSGVALRLTARPPRDQ